MTDIVHEAQDTHLCALFIGAHGDAGDYEYALDAANSAAKHLQAIQADLPATSPLATPAYSLSLCAQYKEICLNNGPQIILTSF